MAVTPKSLPIVTGLGLGNKHESKKLIPLLNDIQIRINCGRPKSGPGLIWTDIKYHTLLVLTYLYKRRIKAQIKEGSGNNTKAKQGRPKIFLFQYHKKVRSSVERFSGWLKSFRRIQTRYERLSINLSRTYLIWLHNDTNKTFRMSSIKSLMDDSSLSHPGSLSYRNFIASVDLISINCFTTLLEDDSSNLK